MANFVQALDWQLATVKLNLSDKGFLLEADFGDLGGDDFVYLPYPDIKTYRTEMTNYAQENGHESLLTAPSGQFYKSAHPVVSGLHSNSKYVNSLTKIKKSDPFDDSEGTEKILLNKSYSVSPEGVINELGDFPGKSNIGQIRFFNKPFDMREFLDISYEFPDEVFHGLPSPYSDDDYWKGNQSNNTFSKKSPVGDIFISEYDRFRENCIIELNMGNLNQKTIRDSSGNGSSGILMGDFSVRKEETGISANRDSYIRYPEIDTDKDKGAI